MVAVLSSTSSVADFDLFFSFQNAMTRYLVVEMQHISNLQSDVASMPANLAALDHDLRFVSLGSFCR